MKSSTRDSLRHFSVRGTLPYAPIDPDAQGTPVSLFAPDREAVATEALAAAETGGRLPPDSGAMEIPDRETFERLARRDDVPGAFGVREVKFLVTRVDTETPTIYFMNTNRFQYHFVFATEALGYPLTNQQFNQQTYFTEGRTFLAGTILAHDQFQQLSGTQGLYALEFWPTDPVSVRFVDMAYRLIRTNMSFARDAVAYHPAGVTHEALVQREKEEFDQLGVRHISTDELFGNVSYSPLNLGEGFGRLRRIGPADQQALTIRDVVLFERLPNDLTHVAGVLTEEPQTPLSHVNLKAKQNDTPNAYLKNASRDPRVEPLIDELVFLKVASDEIEIRPATREEVDSHIERLRPAEPQVPRRDLDRKEIVDLRDIGHTDLEAYGAKAANVAELRKILTVPGMVPDGYAVPFFFYHRFMSENGLDETVAEMISRPDFRHDAEEREDALRKIRRRIKRASMPAELADALATMHASFPAGQPLRCRSSTNNEDLEGFNGAGLYDSYTHREDEGHIEKSIQQVWASLWNYRAFEEREFYRIDHFKTAMAVLVHPNFDDELANGVGLTRNIFDPNWEGYYINVQVGEALVTNPEAGAVPDELLVMRTVVSENPVRFGYETIYIRRSSLVVPPNHVLSSEQIDQLAVHMRAIQAHFVAVYGRQDDDAFAMDIELRSTATISSW
ncbi:MAG: PEP/pyruvate-binding domain-containing protein [Acidobacteriota bacterium]